MEDRRKAERRQNERRASGGSATAASVYSVGGRFLVIPKDLTQDFQSCKGLVDEVDGDGAWLAPESDEEKFSTEKELMLIAFDERWVHTHYVEVLKRRERRIMVDAPSVTERERSQLAPSTGRFDYRIRVNLPVRIKDLDEIQDDDVAPRLGRLLDLSRGGMALLMPGQQEFRRDQRLVVRVVGWDYPVSIHAQIQRVHPPDESGKQKLALIFPDELTVKQRESISSFIIQVQRRDALLRALPSSGDEDTY